jgi:hypothetical protein
MSKRTSPHVLTVMEVDMSKVVAHRKANKATFARDGINLTFTAYFMQAVVTGLKAYPNVNSSWTDEGLLIHANINIGMATSLGEEGLDRAGHQGRGRAVAAGDGADGQRSGEPRPLEEAQPGRRQRWNLHLNQSRHQRLAVRLPGHQPAAERDPGRGRDAEARGGAHRRGRQRFDRYPPDGLSLVRVRPPHPGRRVRGLVPGQGQGDFGELELNKRYNTKRPISVKTFLIYGSYGYTQDN